MEQYTTGELKAIAHYLSQRVVEMVNAAQTPGRNEHDVLTARIGSWLMMSLYEDVKAKIAQQAENGGEA